MDTLKQRAVRGVGWNFAARLSQQLVQFALGIVIARILSPAEFGLMGMVAVFVAITQALVDGGFGQALIQKQDADDVDASSVFYLNLIVSLLLAGVLCLIAPLVAAFYEQPILAQMMYCLALGPIFAALGRVHTALLTKKLDFKTQMKVGVSATAAAGVVGLILAYYGFGVWSLVIASLTMELVRSLALWLCHAWRPRAVFDVASLRQMWSFGAPLLASGVLDTVFQHVHAIVIGRVYAARDVGLFTRARSMQQLPIHNLTQSVTAVTFPVFSEIQGDRDRMLRAVRKTMLMLAFIVFPVVALLTASADALVRVLLTDKWAECVPLLQLLCISQALYPLQVVNLNVIKARGRSDLFFRLEVIKKVLTVVAIAVTFRHGIAAMIIGQGVVGLIAFVLNGRYTSATLGYTTFAQLRDIAPYAALATFAGVVVYLISMAPIKSQSIVLFLQVSAGIVSYSASCFMARLAATEDAISTISSRLRSVGTIGISG